MKKRIYNLRMAELINGQDMRQKLSNLVGDGDGNKPQIRKEVLAFLKENYKSARKKCEGWLFEDGDGNLCSRRLSGYQDELIALIYDFAVTHVFQINNPSSAEHMAVTAVGGYGRGTLAPGSDIDLLFILPYKQTPWGESVVEYILYMLWDMGFKVGQATRTIDECLRLAREDFTICTSVLEVRFIWGEKELHDVLIERFINEVMKGTAQEFIAAKMQERDERHEKTGRSRYLVEPNIKDGKGGLRDLHTLFWIAKYYYRVATRRELIKLGVFTRAEYNRFRKAQNFLWTVRCHMHFLTGRAEDRLNFELQREMAARLGYTSHPGLSAVERFMKHYFLTAKDVGDLTLIFCSKLEEEELITHSGISQIVNRIKLRSRKIKGTKDFVEQNGRINVANDEVFINDPTNLLRVFKIAHKHDYHYHPDLFRLITRSFKLINAKLRKDKKANKIFIDILTSKKDPENTLRRMNESGVLGRFIPAFGKVIAMMQFNMYHHYTVDEHLLRSIGILHEIEQGELEEEHPLANQLMPNIAERKVLYVALLLHDIAKGRPEDHSIEGAKIARKLCPRLGLSREQTALVAWLIEEHLTMSNISQSRDLADRKTITDFAAIVQTMERMKLLLILTICDIKAVGTGVWNGWKGQLLRTLYYETEPQLTGGFSKMSRKERVAMAKEDLMAALFAQDDWSEEEATYWINLQYSAYLLTVATEDQVRHLNFLRASTKAEKKFALGADTKKFEAITELMIMAQDHPKLLSVIAGACTAAGANIADAKIYTTRDGRAFNTIFINRIFESGTDERRRAANIEKLIEGVLKGENKLPDIIAEKARPNKKAAAFSITPVAKIDNTLSEKFTVIEIEGLDRPGLLSEVTHALSSLFLDIASAHIATFGEKVVDSFYVTDLTGAKITSVDRQKSIYKTLISLLKKGQKGNGKAA